MLDKNIFLEGLKYLKAYYTNWKVDLNPDVLKVWYKKFYNLNEAQYQVMIENYADNNKFPPNNPTDLIEELKNVYFKVEPSPDEAWEYVRQVINEESLMYHPDRFYARFEDKPLIKKTVEQFESRLIGLRTVDVENVSREFKNAYKTHLDSNVEGKTTNLLTGNNTKQIKGDFYGDFEKEAKRLN